MKRKQVNEILETQVSRKNKIIKFIIMIVIIILFATSSLHTFLIFFSNLSKKSSYVLLFTLHPLCFFSQCLGKCILYLFLVIATRCDPPAVAPSTPILQTKNRHCRIVLAHHSALNNHIALDLLKFLF